MGRAMHGMRAFFGNRHSLALALVVLALCLKAFVPAGYMVGSDAKILTIKICADTHGAKLSKQIAVPMTGQHPLDNADHHDAAKNACAFSALAFAAVTGADGLLLAAALTFIIALGFLPVETIRTRAPRFQRPPLRGPPLPA